MKLGAHRIAEKLRTLGAMREWTSQDAPGDAAVRLRSVRVWHRVRETSAAVDMRNPFGIEVSYEVLENGRALLPVIELYN